jgi:hypothetical protein
MFNKIKTFEGACKVLKLDPKKALPVVSGMPKQHREAIIAHAKLVIIAEALNGDWKPDWSDYNQWKYYPWFEMKSSRFGYDGSYVNYSSYSNAGSRLCFRSAEIAKYAGQQFKSLYKQYFLFG